jgi:Rho GDP-dissociation inhibitor
MDQPPPELDLAETFKKEANDPAMIAYMKSIGIDPDYVPPKNDPRRVVINEFAVIFKDHDKPVVLKFENDEDLKKAKKHPMVIKEGCKYKLRVTFRVQHNVVLGLKILNEVKKLGKTLSSDTEMLGTYPPKHTFQSIHIPDKGWAEAPAGMIARGEYSAKMKFTDDDNAKHLEFEYAIKIAKDYVE